MTQLAQEKRNATAQEMEHIILVSARAILKSTKYGAAKEEALYNTLDATYKACIKAGCTDQDFSKVQIGIVHKVYGDPQSMYASTSQKMHALPYWNPTKHRINVAPMGIPVETDPKTKESILLEFVEPGAHVMIPEPYTKGGKYSTLRGVAPQLVALPREVDECLDLSPVTYSEWCTWMHSPMSNCCRRTTAWYDKGQRLVCTKCGQSCTGTSF
jgi:hypothetical protein